MRQTQLAILFFPLGPSVAFSFLPRKPALLLLCTYTLRGEDFFGGCCLLACFSFMAGRRMLRKRMLSAVERKQEKDVELANVRWRPTTAVTPVTTTAPAATTTKRSFHLVLYSLHACRYLEPGDGELVSIGPLFLCWCIPSAPLPGFLSSWVWRCLRGKKDPKRWGGKRRRKSVRDLNAFSIQATKESQSSRRNIN